MTKVEPKTLKGFRDFLPNEARKRAYVLDTLKSVFESYGFEPLETPALEYEEILLGKYGEEGDKLMYRFEDNGKRKVALRYDQTVPLARVVAQYQNDLPLPFKRYQIQNVWRADNTQKGRYREFLQVDIDTVGSSSPLSDAEIVELVTRSYEKLGIRDFKIVINDRRFLDEYLASAGVREDKIEAVSVELDKLDKLSSEEVGKRIFNIYPSLASAATVSGTITSMDELVNPPSSKIETLQDWMTDRSNQNYYDFASPKTLKEQLAMESANVKEFFYIKAREEDFFGEFLKLLEKMNISKEKVEVNPRLARGLDYYTGLIIEVKVDGYSGGSLGGGGRYDNLVGMFAGRDIPAVGFAFGFDRIIEAMEDQDLFPANLRSVDILVTNSGEKSTKVADELREMGLKVELYVDDKEIDKQLRYADRKQIPYVLLFEGEKMILKNMKDGSQKEVTLDSVKEELS